MSSLKTIIWGFEGQSGLSIVKAISADPDFQVVHTVNDFGGSENIFDYLRCDENLHTKSFDEKIYKSVYNSGLNKFTNMFSRHYQDYSWTYHDFVDAFNIFFNRLFNVLCERKPDLVIFSNIPHEGPDFILYLLAKELGIKTLLFYQSLFKEKFFIVTKLDDFGQFKSVNNVSVEQKIKIKKRHEDEYFYMSNVAPIAFRRPRYLRLAKLVVSKKLFTVGIELVKNYRFNRFVDAIRRNEKDLNLHLTKYVYFPLAMQPELTTSAIGKLYNDQLLAIERLVHILPADWKVVVKENPKQTDFQRGHLFFQRLKMLKNVVLAPVSYNTHELTRHSEFVAVVTGTAGWEAIKGGKKALIFGNAWYQKLPGAITYEDGLKIEDVLGYSFEHSSLENEFSALMTKCGIGLVDDAYSVEIETFDVDSNSTKVLNSIKKVVSSEDTIWE
ncbi:MAG: hypothetical protein ACMVP2_11375 [Imperialibacter sp.]|uniref:capsular polysaccharide export protein, LipB/KpsS family n=1 Tax=Imperialibacter sp. TaxID=2038411 RepID=UPI0030DC64EE|tara:strand:+ start:11473 stop:12798 length:1326 start_codon:yes stop_codon:yes gene_type:complete